MSNAALTWVTEHSPYRGGKYALHLMLADTASDPDHELWGRQQYFADKARIDRARCCVYLKEMVDEGTLILVEDHSKRRKPNRYRMVMPVAAVKVFDCRTGAYAKNMPTFIERAEAVGETCAPAQHVETDKVPSCAAGQHEHVRSEHQDMCAGATQNPSPSPSPNPRKTARGDGHVEPGRGAVASDRARAASPKTSDPSPHGDPSEKPRASGQEDVSNTGATLFESAGSTADAVADPPSSAAPPRRSGPAGADDPDFVRFWEMAPSGYPNHDGRKDAYAAWRSARKKATAGQLLTAWEAYTAEWATWPEEDRRFVPAERNWLSRGLWEKPVQARRRLTPVASEGEDYVQNEMDRLKRAMDAGFITEERLWPGRQIRPA